MKDNIGIKAFASVAVLCMLMTVEVGAQKSDSPVAWNNNSLITVQQHGGDPTRRGDVNIEFYGHDAFKITSPAGLTVLADPWRNDAAGVYQKWFLTDFPEIRVDIVLSTHSHFDHDAVERPKGLMVLERLVGQFRLGDLEITGLADKHKCGPAPDTSSAGFRSELCPPNNEMDLDNAIQIIQTGGLRIGIWGDNRAVPDASLDGYLRNLDVLILPIETVLTRDEVDRILQKYDPRAIIPAHYFVKGLMTDGTGLEAPDKWLHDREKVNAAEVVRLNAPELNLNPLSLKDAHGRVFYFGNHFEKK